MLTLFSWEITSDLFFWGAVSSVFSPKMFKKQDGLLAFFVMLCPRFSCPKVQKSNTKCSPFSPEKNVLDLCVCTVSSVFFPKMSEKLDRMPAFFI